MGKQLKYPEIVTPWCIQFIRISESYHIGRIGVKSGAVTYGCHFHSDTSYFTKKKCHRQNKIHDLLLDPILPMMRF